MTMMQMMLGAGGTLAIISATSAWQGGGPTSHSVTIAKPSQAQLNDLFVSFLAADSSASITPGAGFSEDYDAMSRPMGEVAHLSAGASEPSSYDFSTVSKADLCGAIVCLRGAAFDVPMPTPPDENAIKQEQANTARQQASTLADMVAAGNKQGQQQ